MDVDDRSSRPPSRCPYGHPLAGELVQVGWQPCQCLTALARCDGHITYTCRVCSDQGWIMVYFAPDPIHSSTKTPPPANPAAKPARSRQLPTEPSPKELAGYQRALSTRPHLTPTPAKTRASP